MKKTFTPLLILLSLATLSFGQATKKVILEDETDVGCGYCPRGKTVMEQTIAAHPNVIGIANHVTAIGPDAMANSYSLGIDVMNTYGYPGGMVDRTLFAGQSTEVIATNYWQSKCITDLLQTTPFEINISSNYNSTSRVLNVTVGVNYLGGYTAPSGTDLRISCVLIEDSVVGVGSLYSQHNYMGQGCAAPDPTSPWYTYPCIINGYVHDNVARANMAPIWGTPGILPATGTTGQSFSTPYTYTLPATWRENKMKVVAFVSLYGSSMSMRTILNANEINSIMMPTGISDIEGSVSGLNVFPNPASDFVTVKANLNKPSNTTINIYDILGKTVFTQEYKTGGSIFEENVSLQGISNGVYFLTITSQDSKITRKIFVNKNQE